MSTILEIYAHTHTARVFEEERKSESHSREENTQYGSNNVSTIYDFICIFRIIERERERATKKIVLIKKCYSGGKGGG